MKNNTEKGYYLELVIPRHQLLSTLLENAMQKKDWEKIASLIELNPTFMEEGLTRVYPILPVEYNSVYRLTATFITAMGYPPSVSMCGKPKS